MLNEPKLRSFTIKSWKIWITEAKLKEIENYKNNKVYQELDDENQNKRSINWVITEKVTDGVLTPKSKLVAPGFENWGINVVKKDSPTSGRENLRILFSIISFLVGILVP